jgi:transcriptional regulator with XRE-family HTH domain
MSRRRIVEGWLGQGPTRPASGRFGKLLRQLRLERGISQAELGRGIGLGHSIVSRYETGERTPRRRTIAAIADALGLDSPERMALFRAAGYHYAEEGEDHGLD